MTDSPVQPQQGLANWRTAITERPASRASSSATTAATCCPRSCPQGVNVTSDPCSEQLAGGDFTPLTLRFFDEKLKGRRPASAATASCTWRRRASKCTTVRTDAADKAYAVGTVAHRDDRRRADGDRGGGGADRGRRAARRRPPTSPPRASTSRIFYGLAVGTSPLDAKLVQNNVMPLREATPVDGAKRRFTLPSVAVDVPAGQSLFLLATPVSDTFVGMGSRPPGLITLDNTIVNLPVVGP